MRFDIPFSKPIAFFPIMAKCFGSVEAALYIQQLAYWSDKGTRKDGFIYKTKNEIEEETSLSCKQQDRVKKQLIQLGALTTKLMKVGGVPTLHYKLDIEIIRKGIMDYAQRAESDMPKQHNPLTENTTENTNASPSEEPTLNQSSIEEKVVPPPPHVVAGKPSIRWAHRMAGIWGKHYGVIATGRIGKALKGAVSLYNEQQVAEALYAYCKGTEATYASPERFSMTILQWLPKAKPEQELGHVEYKAE